MCPGSCTRTRHDRATGRPSVRSVFLPLARGSRLVACRNRPEARPIRLDFVDGPAPRRERHDPNMESPIMFSRSSALAGVILLAASSTAGAQLGRQQGLVEPNIAADTVMLALPHVTPA